jgi:hypothetical protein
MTAPPDLQAAAATAMRREVIPGAGCGVHRQPATALRGTEVGAIIDLKLVAGTSYTRSERADISGRAPLAPDG